MTEYDVIVVGGGPAGMAAALGAEAAGSKRVALIERSEVLGGILNQCTHSGFGINYFGEELTGIEYARRFVILMKTSGIRIFTDTAAVDISSDGIITLSGERTGFTQVRAAAVILAAGCRERPIGSLPVSGTRPSGVFSAGAAQKLINLGGYDIGNRFIILGSGDVGLIVARELALRGKEVLAVIEKEDRCGGLPRNRIQCLEHFGIPLVTRSTVTEIHGSGRISGVTVAELTGGNRRYIGCDTLITSTGLIPERELLENVGKKGLPDWIFLCGNACYVHDAVDDVTVESEKVGRLAAGFASGGEPRCTECHDKPESAAVISEGAICYGCPKSCRVRETGGIWRGMACGRERPVSTFMPPD